MSNFNDCMFHNDLHGPLKRSIPPDRCQAGPRHFSFEDDNRDRQFIGCLLMMPTFLGVHDTKFPRQRKAHGSRNIRPMMDRISRETATGYLKRLYRANQRPNQTIANIYRAHSLRPHTSRVTAALTVQCWVMLAINHLVYRNRESLRQCPQPLRPIVSNHHTHAGDWLIRGSRSMVGDSRCVAERFVPKTYSRAKNWPCLCMCGT